MADRDAGQLGIAGPFALAGDDEVEIELADQPHAVGPRGVVDAGEGLVQQHQARRAGAAALAVEAGHRCKQRHRQAERALAAGGRARQLAPLAVLPALDPEAVPVAVVQCPRQLVEQEPPAVLAQALVGAGTLGLDALLQHRAHHPPVLGRPQVGAGVQQAFARRLQPDRRAVGLGQRLPQQAEAHPRAGRALVQLAVDGLDLALGGLQQALHFGGDLGLQVVLQHAALYRRQQLAALVDFIGQPGRQAIGPLGLVLVNDVHHQAPVAGLGRRLVAQRAQAALQLGQLFGDAALHPGPGLVVVGHRAEQLLGAARQAQRGVDGPGLGEIGHFKLRQRGGQQASGGKLLQPRHRQRPRLAAALQLGLGRSDLGAGHRAGFTGRAGGLAGHLEPALVCRHRQPGLAELALQLAHLGTDGLLQDLQPGTGLLGLGAAGHHLPPGLLLVGLEFGLAAPLALQIGRGAAQLAGGVQQAVLGLVELAECSLHRGQRRQGVGQAQVGGVLGQQRPRRRRGLRGQGQSGIGTVQQGAQRQQLASAVAGLQMGLAQRAIAGRAAPFMRGLLLVLLQGRQGGLMGGLLFCPGQPPLRDGGETLSPGGGARGKADVDRRRLVPGPCQRTQAELAAGADPAVGINRVLCAAGHAGQQPLDHCGRHRAGGVVGGLGRLQPLAQGGGRRRARRQVAVVQQRLAVGRLHLAAGPDPGVEQAGGLQCGLQAGPLVGVHRASELQQLPQRSAWLIRTAGLGGPGVRPRRRGIDPGQQRAALCQQGVFLVGQCLLPGRQCHLAGGLAQAGLLLGLLQQGQGRVVALQRGHPGGQLGEGGLRRGCSQRQLAQAGSMRLPGVLQRLALLQHRLVGLAAAGGAVLGGVQRVVAALPALLLLGDGLGQLGMALAQQRHLLTPAGQQRAQPRRRGLKRAGCQRHQRIGRQCHQGLAGEGGGQPGGLGGGGQGLARIGQLLGGQRQPLLGVAALLLAAGQAPAGLGQRGDGHLQGGGARGSLAIGAFQPVGVLHRRVGQQGVDAGALVQQGQLGAAQRGLRLGLLQRGGLLAHEAVLAGPAGAVELGLGLAHGARLAPALHAGIGPVALVEAAHRSGHGLVGFELAAVFLQLAQGLGHVVQQLGGQRRQGLGQRIRQRAFVGLLRQLRCAQLDQGVHQRVVAPGPQLEQALIDGAAVGLAGVEDLAQARQRLAQPLLAQHLALRVGQPPVLIQALGPALRRIVEHKEPALDLRPRRAGRQAGAQCQVVRRAVVGQAAELDPGIADTAVVAAHQQVPGHALASVAVGLDARGQQPGVEQEGQGQRQDLGFAGAVVAAQQQVAVAEPELLAVVVVELDQAQPQGLPAGAAGQGQRRWVDGGRCVEAGQRIAHQKSNSEPLLPWMGGAGGAAWRGPAGRAPPGLAAASAATPWPASAKRAMAGNGRSSSPSRASNCNWVRRWMASAASSCSAPGSRADLRQ